ncbi:MAG: hypothetical protein KatS3mg076_2968 [Candidatus Binatia bacterium]|nr:MAG: hypothetical protein KatS3mg076_2968 [Candidatus Binatia bacterium]
MRRSTRTVAGAAVLFLFFLGAGILPHAVLCIEGSHVAIELVESPRCHPAAGKPSAVRGDDCARDCRDIRVGNGKSLQRSADERATQASPERALSFSRPVGLEIPEGFPTRSNRSVSVPVHGTTVLLC